MIEFIYLGVAVVGTVAASLFDVKLTPTEIPDEIPHAMILFGVITSLLFFSEKTINYAEELGLTAVLAFMMYKLGQWGGGDSKMLVAVVSLSPGLSLIYGSNFSISYVLNVFFVGAFYSIINVLVLACKKGLLKKIVRERDVAMKSLLLFFLSFSLFSIFNYISMTYVGIEVTRYFFMFLTYSLILSSTITVSYFLWRLMKRVDEKCFRKRIKVEKLKEGDVLLPSKEWKGLSRKEVELIKRSGRKYVWIKTGICFAPVFSLSLLTTYLLRSFFSSFLIPFM